VDPDLDLLTNIYATSVSAGDAIPSLDNHPLDKHTVGSSFELLYNVACAQISAGMISEAEDTLLSAKEMCESVLSQESADKETVETECAAINLQRAYVDILRGKVRSSSLDQCRSILRSQKSLNKELLAVAANNLTVLRGDKDLPDSLRRLRLTISTASEERLTRGQLMQIRYNRCILLLHLKKIDECTRSLDELDKMLVSTLSMSSYHRIIFTTSPRSYFSLAIAMMSPPQVQ
jgi:hypothetical protein